jgi:zinc protease
VLQAVTAEDIMAAATKVFNRDQAVTAWVVASREGLTQ